MKRSNLMALLAASSVALTGAAALAQAPATEPAPATTAQPSDTDSHRHDRDGEHKEKKDKAAKKDKNKDGKANKADKGKKAVTVQTGAAAPAFTLTDTDGTSHSLADHKGKIVVLEWFNPDCPFIKKHHEQFTTFNDLHRDYSGKDVVFLAINSGAEGKQGAGRDYNAKAKQDFEMPYPVLLDEAGTVGKAYGAKTTPHVFIIDADGKLAYQGAVDNNASAGKLGDVNHVKTALDQLIRKETVTTTETKPYGCAVKYAG